MKVYRILCSKPTINVTPLGNRLYKLCDDVTIRAFTDEGVFTYSFHSGFVTNFRSGGLFVDRFIDQIGSTTENQACWLIHDAAYTPCAACRGEHPISRKLADDLLRATLLFAGMAPCKAGAVYYSVRAFGGSAYADDDALTESNSVLFKFELLAA